MQDKDDDEEPDFAAIGFMFDANHSKSTFCLRFGDDIEVQVRTVGDTPGHRQSGHFLWPAATACANYLIANWSVLHSRKVLELGSGCGLPALVLAKLADVEAITCTDYDLGTLALIEESFTLNSVSSCKFKTEYLQWGDALRGERFALVIGSDLIYSIDVIRPLFTTVSNVLEADGGRFVLVTSFAIGQDLEAAVDASCAALGLHRQLVQAADSNKDSCKIEHYTLSPVSSICK